MAVRSFRFLATALLALLPGLARADVEVVETGSTYPTIQQAIANAPIGATLRIGPGVYEEAITIDRDLSLVGDGVGTVLVTWATDAPDAVIEVERGHTTYISGLTVHSTRIPAIDSQLADVLQLVEVELSGKSFAGGALYVTGDSAILDRVTVRDSVADGGDGGGVYANVSQLTITDSLFTGNGAPFGDGGALYADGGTVTLVDTVFTDNAANLSGGAVALRNAQDASLVRVTLCGNTSASGGGLWASGTGTVSATIVDGNTAPSGGAGMMFSEGPWRVLNATVVDSSGPEAVLFANGSNQPEVQNSLFAYNPGTDGIRVGTGPVGPVEVHFNAFYQIAQEISGASLGAGNLLSEDPELSSVILTSCADELWPEATSPLLDAGSPLVEFSDPDGSINDIGAFGGPDAPAWFHADDDGDGVHWRYDCDDDNPDSYPGAPEQCDGEDNDCNGVVDDGPDNGDLYYVDLDGDTYGDGNDPGERSCEPIYGKVLRARDCDDTNPNVHPGVPENCEDEDLNCDGDPYWGAAPDRHWYPDRDEDGYGDDSISVAGCFGPDDYIVQGGDCDDDDPDIHPGQPELMCDGIDENCTDGEADHPDATNWWPDSDGDGYGDALSPEVLDCLQPADHVAVGGDCNDSEPAQFPGNPEVCDGIDNDCNARVDDGEPTTTWWPDNDGDGYGSEARNEELFCAPDETWVQQGGDCDDNDDTVFDGAPEVCDGLDNDCDGDVDLDDDDVQSTTVWEDKDGDGYGAGDAIQVCDTTGYALQDGDCRDVDADIHPGAVEEPDNDIDENCDDVMDNAPSDRKLTQEEPKPCRCQSGVTPASSVWLLWGAALFLLRRRS